MPPTDIEKSTAGPGAPPLPWVPARARVARLAGMTTLKWATGMCEHRRAKPRDDSGVLVATAVERLVSHVQSAPLPSLVPPAISAGMTCLAPVAAIAARCVHGQRVGKGEGGASS